MPLVLQLTAQCDKCGKRAPVEFPMPLNGFNVARPQWTAPPGWMLPGAPDNPYTRHVTDAEARAFSSYHTEGPNYFNPVPSTLCGDCHGS